MRATTTPARVWLPVRLVSMRRTPSTSRVAARTSWPSSRSHGNQLAGQLLLVDQPDAADDRAVDRDLVARIDDDDVADHHLAQRHLDFNAVAFDPRHLAQQVQQVQVGPRGAPRRQVADDLAQFDQPDHERWREEEPEVVNRVMAVEFEEVDVQLPLVPDACPGALERGNGGREQGGADDGRRDRQAAKRADGHAMATPGKPRRFT